VKGSLTRTLLQFLLLSILLLLLTAGVCYYAAYQDAAAQAADHARSLLDDTAKAVAVELDDVIDSAQMLSNESSLYQFIKSDVSGRFEQKELLQTLLKSFTDFKPLVVRMFLYTGDRSALLSGAQEVDVYSPLLYSLFLRVKDDYQLLKPYQGVVLTQCYACGNGKTNFAILIPVYAPVAAPQDSDYLGSLVAMCDAERFGTLMPDGGQRKMLLAQGENLLYTNDASFTLADLAQSDVISETVSNTEWTLYSEASPVNLSSQLSGVFTVCIVVCSMAILAQAMLLLALRRDLIMPIIHIADQTDAITDGSLKVHNPSGERNELTRLTNGINGMLTRIRLLDEQILSTRLKLYKERVMFLQGQMNPHFLYNNLACIRGMAGSGNGAAVRSIASEMAAIYRYCAQSEPVATLSDELDCVKQYEEIYRLRKEGVSHSLDIRADGETLRLTTPRMFLQPLVENAFRHGYAAGGKGTVRISAAFEGDVLTVRVADHGAGMPPEQLESLNRTEPDDDKAMTGHLGLMNVWRRVQIIFGPESGMRFEETPGGGLTVIVRLPQKNVKSGDIQTI